MPAAKRSPSSPVPRCAARCCRARLGLQPGQVFKIGRSASVQFAGERGMIFRLTAVEDRLTNHGWVWLSGYELDQRGTAVARREIFVQLAGLWATLPDATRE